VRGRSPDASAVRRRQPSSDLDVFDRRGLRHRSSSTAGFGAPSAVSSAAFRQLQAFVADAPFCLPRLALFSGHGAESFRTLEPRTSETAGERLPIGITVERRSFAPAALLFGVLAAERLANGGGVLPGRREAASQFF
jgi:hypothetical protein